MRQHRARHRHRTKDIHLELVADIDLARHLEMAELPVAGVVHQHVDRAELQDRARDRARHAGGVGDVEHRQMKPVTLRQLALQLVERARDRDDIVSGGEQRPGDSRPSPRLVPVTRQVFVTGLLLIDLMK